jgi:hypothetical protein
MLGHSDMLITMSLISSLLAAATEMPGVGSVAPDFTLPARSTT